MTPRIQILPSLLAADVGNLEAGARKAEKSGGDGVHIDIMDGHFVPNLTMGPEVVRMARRRVRIPIVAHLMITNPGDFIEPFVKAGAATVLIHIEVSPDPVKLLHHIRRLGAHPGLTLNPETPAEAVVPFIREADEVLCMTVHPGFGGQAFMAEVLPKMRTIRNAARRSGHNLDISVDGGITAETAPECAAHGANVFIVGTALYEAKNMTTEIADIRRQAQASFS